MPNYINRKVALFSLVQERSIKLYFDDNLKSTLFELCMKEKHIVLLGEAGWEIHRVIAFSISTISAGLYVLSRIY